MRENLGAAAILKAQREILLDMEVREKLFSARFLLPFRAFMGSYVCFSAGTSRPTQGMRCYCRGCWMAGRCARMWRSCSDRGKQGGAGGQGRAGHMGQIMPPRAQLPSGWVKSYGPKLRRWLSGSVTC